MQTLPLDQIKVTDRQRSKIQPQHIQKLKLSILSKGLLHPPVLSSTGSLVAGECRLRAMTELHEEMEPFHCNGQPVPHNHIPVTYVSDLTPVDLMEAELEENVLRSDLEWLEESAARVKIHNLRESQNSNQTLSDTAKEIAEVKKTSPTTERIKLAKSLLVQEHKDAPEVKAAKSLDQAHKLILDKIEVDLRARQIKLAPVEGALHRVIHGDCLTELSKLPDGQFDGIMTDPPYGIDADTMKNTSQHFYDDSAENALKICKFIIKEGHRVTKPKAFLFMFCDIEHFLGLRTFAQQHGWATWRAPVIFRKGNTGHAPWGRAGFVRTYEILLFAVKGKKELLNPGGPDIIETVSRHKAKAHAAEKPPELWEFLMKKAFLQGASVLDPCCGAGAIFTAGTICGIRTTGIEISQDYYNKALIRSQAKTPEETEPSLEDLLEDE